MILENYAIAQVERTAILLLAREWPVAKVLTELFEILNRAEIFCISWYVFVNSFEKLLLQHWKVRPRFQKCRTALVLWAGDGALRTEALVCLDTKWFREKCMAGAYVFFECCGSCLLSLDLSARLGFLSISLLVLRTSSFLFCALVGFFRTSSLLLC